MSYLVLARKWRPQTFDKVVGQDHVTHTLKKAVEKGRLAHAYLFAGPRGCGKTTTARLLAKAINCENLKQSEPCNSCSSCLAVIEGRHLDTIEIDGASNRGIDEIRDLREKIGYAPSQSGSKIYIIDEVHMLTPQAFNALLKTLEEPPQHVYFIFATTEPHKIPPTILSRCQRFNFKRLELDELIGQLERICKSEKVKYEREALVLIARRAEGSMRDAESLLDQCISASDDKIDLPFTRRILGLVETHLVTELLGAIGRRDRSAALAVVDRVVSSGLDMEELFLGLIEGLRNLLVLSVSDGESLAWLDLTDAEIGELRTIGEVFKTEDLLFLFRSSTRSFREFKGSSQPRYQLEAAIAEAASWESAVELTDLIDRLGSIDVEVRGSGPRGSGGGTGSAETGRGEQHAEGNRNNPVTGASASSHISEKEQLQADVKSDRRVHRNLPLDGNVSPGGGNAPSDGTFAAGDEGGQRYTGESATLAELGGKEQWERFLSQVRESKLTLGIWLTSAQVREVTGDKIVLAFSSQNRFAQEMVSEDKNRRYIESQLERFFGRRFIVETGESKDTGNKASEPPAAAPVPKELAENEPVMKRIIEEFDGELLSE